MNIGEKLFELRKGKNLSQEEVAEKLNVTRQTVSKWETNQTTPDFDKIMPICELFEITTEELLTGNKIEKEIEETSKEEEKPLSEAEIKRKSAEVVSTSIFLYFLSIVFIMVAIPVMQMNPIVASAIFLLIIGWATARIVKHYMSVPKIAKTKLDKNEYMVLKQIKGVIGAVALIVYIIVSFRTFAFHITWLIFVIGGIVGKIVELTFMLKEDKESEK